MEEKLKESFEHLSRTITTLNEATRKFLDVLDCFYKYDETSVQYHINSIKSVANYFAGMTLLIEGATERNIDNTEVSDPELAEEIFKIKFNKSPNCNPAPGESQEP